MMSALIPQTVSLQLSGERFRIVYRLGGTEEDARARARDICLEQSVEFPEELVPEGPIRDHVVGRQEHFEPCGKDAYQAVISFPVETAGDDLGQLLNVVLGNISLKPAIRAENLELPPSLLSRFRGPRFGRTGLRELTGAAQRPLVSTALKPMGLSPVDLAELAYRFALGGIDLIKDDHGLTNQTFSRFEERLARCTEAVAKANRQTGMKSLYLPNVTASPAEMIRRARLASQAGAGGLLVCPGICGLDAVRAVADDDATRLPIMAHPAFQGSFVVRPEEGFSHGLIFGIIARLAGADATIFPNFGGRFSFSREQCCEIAAASEAPLDSLRPIFPAPAGGLTLTRVSEVQQAYGRELVILVGGGLFKHGPDLTENCRVFRELAEKFC
ncbi:MAG: RuBisCO large subunit C-terminal-like domain-containing protein [Thermoguttaceae bacterium]